MVTQFCDLLMEMMGNIGSGKDGGTYLKIKDVVILVFVLQSFLPYWLTSAITEYRPAFTMKNVNTILILALSFSVFINLATSRISYLLTIVCLLLALITFAPSIARRVVQILQESIRTTAKKIWVDFGARLQQKIAHVMDTAISVAIMALHSAQAVYHLLRDILFHPFVENVRLLFRGENGQYEDEIYTSMLHPP